MADRFLAEKNIKRSASWTGYLWDKSGKLRSKSYRQQGQKFLEASFICVNEPDATTAAEYFPLIDPNNSGQSLPLFWPSYLSARGADIWRFYRDRKGPLKPFYYAEGYPRPNLRLASGVSAGATTITLTSVSGLTTTLYAEGQLIAISNPQRSIGDPVGISSINGLTVELKKPLAYSYDTSADIRIMHPVVFDTDLELRQPHRHVYEFKAKFRVVKYL
jgi:hypothetical protein